MQTEGDCNDDDDDEYNNNIFLSERDEPVIIRDRINREKGKIFEQKPLPKKDQKENNGFNSTNISRPTHKPNQGSFSMKPQENNNNINNRNLPSSQIQNNPKRKDLVFASVHQPSFQDYSKDNNKENRNPNKENINTYLKQPFTILAPDNKTTKTSVVAIKSHSNAVSAPVSLTKPLTKPSVGVGLAAVDSKGTETSNLQTKYNISQDRLVSAKSINIFIIIC
jgi:hypothetical protein